MTYYTPFELFAAKVKTHAVHGMFFVSKLQPYISHENIDHLLDIRCSRDIVYIVHSCSCCNASDSIAYDITLQNLDTFVAHSLSALSCVTSQFDTTPPLFVQQEQVTCTLLISRFCTQPSTSPQQHDMPLYLR